MERILRHGVGFSKCAAKKSTSGIVLPTTASVRHSLHGLDVGDGALIVDIPSGRGHTT